MAKNDVVLIDSLLRGRAVNSSLSQGDLFELFVIEQVLKNYDLSSEDIEAGWIDGTHDGGIDAFYTLVNGRPLFDPVDFPWPRSGAELKVLLFTCKHRDTFQQAPLDALLASLQELFDLAKPTADLTGKYSPELRKCRDSFIAAFDNLSLCRPTIAFELIYASRGDTTLLGESVAARGAQIEKLFEDYFSACSAKFIALGASELVDLHRQVKSFSLDLPVQECLTAGQEGYVVLARLTDYCRFVRDDKGELRRYLFDSNVRAFLGANLVNSDIAQTLSDPSAPNFWWLNNGVTILTTSASLVGKTLKLRDIQIVNGLQTTESIHRNLSPSSSTGIDHRSVLVKIIVSPDERIRDRVIRATNNQTAVEAAALRATDRIQQDIEAILLRADWYYERRTNFFRNEGRPESRILSPLVLATASVALVLKNPIASSKLKQKVVRGEEAYSLIFSDHHPLEMWPVAAALIRGAEAAVARANQSRKSARAKHLSTWRGVLAYVVAVRMLGSFSYSSADLVKLDISQADDAFFDDCWTTAKGAAGGLGNEKVTEAKMHQLNAHIAQAWSISGNPGDGKRDLPAPLPAAPRQISSVQRSIESEEFLNTVSRALPLQPWPPGIHREIATTLDVDAGRVTRAIQELIRRGHWMKQRDGVVYDRSGNEVMRDPRRASQ